MLLRHWQMLDFLFMQELVREKSSRALVEKVKDSIETILLHTWQI